MPAPAPVLPLMEAAPLLPARGSLIGLDLGTKTIGVAVSDPDRRLATGVETIARKAFTADAQRVLALAAERNAVGFVLGLPINMDGSEGPRAQSTRAFARNFSKLTILPIMLWDERLSTAAVERELIAQDMSRAKRAAVIDEHAAMYILQGALDRLLAGLYGLKTNPRGGALRPALSHATAFCALAGAVVQLAVAHIDRTGRLVVVAIAVGRGHVDRLRLIGVAGLDDIARAVGVTRVIVAWTTVIVTVGGIGRRRAHHGTHAETDRRCRGVTPVAGLTRRCHRQCDRAG